MDWMVPIFIRFVDKIDPTSLVLILMLVLCNYVSVIRSRQDRDDKNELIKVVRSNTDALNKITTVVSVALHRVIE